MRVKHTLEPIYDKNSKILLLGSMPSVKSRECMMYYSHPQNRFWKVLSIIFNEDIVDKKEFVLKHNIALWDTIESCDIEGSSDSSIRNVVPNDINMLVKNSNVKYIFTIGRKSDELYRKYIMDITNIEPILLSSTSPANAGKKLEDLVEEFRVILKFLK